MEQRQAQSNSAENAAETIQLQLVTATSAQMLSLPQPLQLSPRNLSNEQEQVSTNSNQYELEQDYEEVKEMPQGTQGAQGAQIDSPVFDEPDYKRSQSARLPPQQTDVDLNGIIRAKSTVATS